MQGIFAEIGPKNGYPPAILERIHLVQTKFLQSLKYCRTLPSIPVVAIQILSMCQDSKADSKKMAELISHDPAFAAKLLSLANSGFYARIQHRITSLTQGVTLLGRDAVAVLAFSFSLYRNLRGEEFGSFDHQRFWRRSILASIAGRAIAKHASSENYEEVFLGALLQDIGMKGTRGKINLQVWRVNETL